MDRTRPTNWPEEIRHVPERVNPRPTREIIVIIRETNDRYHENDSRGANDEYELRMGRGRGVMFF